MSKATPDDQRPEVWVGHIVLPTDRLEESEAYLRAVGMRPILKNERLAILELRAGTHLLLRTGDEFEPGDAPFDLMVDDIDASHARMRALGLNPSEIADGRIHRSFTLTEPAGHRITVNSSHNSGLPV